jgi:hypothetical protein
MDVTGFVINLEKEKLAGFRPAEGRTQNRSTATIGFAQAA